MIAGVLVSVAGLAVILVISLVTAGPRSSHGCVYLTIPAATGAQEIYQCGGRARSTCASALRSGAFTPQARRVVVAECRKAALPVGGR